MGHARAIGGALRFLPVALVVLVGCAANPGMDLPGDGSADVGTDTLSDTLSDTGDVGLDAEDAAADTGLPDGGESDAGMDTGASDASMDADSSDAMTDAADCVPIDETCNDEDDDCDGRTDEELMRACGVDTGICMVGVERCVDGEFGACTGSVMPGVEACNGLDDDCNGEVDNGIASRTCGSDVGECEMGTSSCVDGEFGVCEGGQGPVAEVCNGLDDDCNGEVDNDIVDVCGTSVGECRTGTRSCTDGAVGECEGGQGPVLEICNDRDDDCDGVIDNGVAARACGSNVGECRMGSQTCADGIFGVCAGSVGPVLETCNGRDDDCNGVNDDGIPAVACGSDVGECSTGTQSCAGGVLGACMGGVEPTPEIEDGLDNDCDGVIDNGIPCESPEEAEQRALTNAERAAVGVDPVLCDRDLRRAARDYAQVICDVRMNPLSNTGPDGRTTAERVEDEGVVWLALGENLAAGGFTATTVTAGWMASPPSRAIMLDPAYGRLGVGYVDCGAPSPHQRIWVQNFVD